MRRFPVPSRSVPLNEHGRRRYVIQIKAAAGKLERHGWRVIQPGLQERECSMSTHPAIDAFLVRLRQWWEAQDNELARMDSSELSRIARDCGMSPEDLTTLASRGPQSADLLYERMALLGLSRADVERAAQGLMKDLQKTCSVCGEKQGCKNDLASKPEDKGWKSYCPNAISLESLVQLKGHFPA